ncbi:MAG: DUF2914 domain-containing protein [Myxococcota bacterium]
MNPITYGSGVIRVRAIASAGGAIGLLAAYIYLSLPEDRENLIVFEDDKGHLISDMVVCERLSQKLEPQGIHHTFPPDVEQLYCWAQVDRFKDFDRVEFVWELDGVVVKRERTDVRISKKSRAYSRLSSIEGEGEWSCRVASTQGRVLATVLFTIQ